MRIQETIINKTDGYICYEGEEYEPFTNDIGRLFLVCQREYGRCVSSIYIGENPATVKRIGWVFEKREKYTDCNETYIQETWVTLHEKPTEVVTKRTVHYLNLPTRN